jgi:osmoprotectant transport system substrate-binding protein
VKTVGVQAWKSRSQLCGRRRLVRAASLVSACVVAVAFTNGRLSSHASTSNRARHPVIVGSFDFTESVLLARIYAAVLRAAGVPVRLDLRLGPRELVEPALRQRLVDVVPEYLGTALESISPDATVDRHDSGAVRAELGDALRPSHLQVLAPAAAQNQNAFVVSRADAERFGLHTVSDLARLRHGVVLGGPAECVRRPYCLLGLRDEYGIKVRRFDRLEGQTQALAALDEDVVDVAVMFTTDGALADPDVTELVDDRRLQPIDQVVPVVSDRTVGRYGPQVVDALDAVSARLTTEALRFLNWRVTFGGKRAGAEARGWLLRQGLLTKR